MPLSQTRVHPISNHFDDLPDKRNKRIDFSERIQREVFKESFGKKDSENGRPAKSIRLTAGLLLIKQLENLSEERVTEIIEENEVLADACGYGSFYFGTPRHSTEPVKFRNQKRFRPECAEKPEEKSVPADTAAQEKNAAYPSIRSFASR